MVGDHDRCEWVNVSYGTSTTATTTTVLWPFFWTKVCKIVVVVVVVVVVVIVIVVVVVMQTFMLTYNCSRLILHLNYHGQVQNNLVIYESGINCTYEYFVVVMSN